MAHPVICVYCKQRFDRDKEPTVQVANRRYAHASCAKDPPPKSQEEIDKEALDNYIMQLFNEEFVSVKIKRQITQYQTEYKYSYSGIHKALIYAFEIKHMDLSKSNNGIGIVPYVYKDAYNYYFSLWEAQQKNENKDMSVYVPKEVVVHIKPPQREIKKRKLFTFLDEEGK